MPPYRRRRNSVPTQQSIVRRRTAGMGLDATPKHRYNNPLDQQRVPGGNASLGALLGGANNNVGSLPNMPNPSAQAYAHASDNARFMRPTPGPDAGPGPVRQGQNPNSPAQGRDPREHLAYWQQQGWFWNPTLKRFVHNDAFAQDPSQLWGGGGAAPGLGPATTGGINQQGGGGQQQGGGGGGINGPGGRPNPQGGGGGGNNTGGGGGQQQGGGQHPPVNEPPIDVPNVPPSDQLPLDAYYEGQRRLFEDQLARELGGLGPMRDQIAAVQAQQNARLNTNENVQHRSMLESLAGRGAFGGGIQRRDEGQLATDYLRQRQDLASDVAGQYGDVALRESGAYGNYNNALAQAMLELAQRQSLDENAVTPHPRTEPTGRNENPPAPNRPPRRNRRRRRSANG